MRTFEQTHPWLTFQADLRSAPPSFWSLLGEAASKCEHLAGVPLMPVVAQQMKELFLAKGAHATTAIEGNTLTEAEVLRRIQGHRELPPSRAYLGREVDNIVRACNGIVQRMFEGTVENLSVELLEHDNAEVLADLDLEPHIVPGRIRTYDVGVARYKGAPAEDCQFLLERLCAWIEAESLTSHGLGQIADGIIKALIAHLYLAWIHPFGDGNGRGARLVELRILIAAGVPDVAAHLLSNHYNATRSEYYRQLERASRERDPLGFYQYALRGFVDQLREQIATVRSQQLRVHWINFVHESFSGRNGSAATRQRNLVLAMSDHGRIRRAEIRTISPKIAEAYADRTAKTISRDINELKTLGLIDEDAHGLYARTDLIEAFLPGTRPSGPSPA
ncbi:MAG: Fic family protein [bacterium]|nr:Fic family protein [bacterium]